MALTAINKVLVCIVLCLRMFFVGVMVVVWYTLCGFELLYPVIFTFYGLFPYPVYVHTLLHDLTPGLTYPGLFALLVYLIIDS